MIAGPRTSRLRKARDEALRRPLAVVFVLAFSLRLAVVLIVRFRFDGYIFLDDKSYLSDFATYAGSNGGQSPDIWISVPSYSRPLGFLFRFVVDDPLTALLPTALAGSLSAVLVAFAVERMTNPKRGLVAGLLVALWPSQIFWSSLVLRDAFIWLAISLVIATWAYLLLPNRAPMGHISLGIVVTLVCIAYVAGSRRHSAISLVAALLIAVVFSVEWRRSIPALLLVGTTVPYFLGFGPFALNLLKDGSSTIATNRAKEVAAAETVIECWDLPFLPRGDESGGGWKNDLLCLPATTTGYLLMPTPNQAFSNKDLVPPLLEAPLWIALYAAAGRNLRRFWGSGLAHRLTAAFLVTTTLMWSLIDRVVGTSFRHRGEIFSALVVLAVVNIDFRITRRIRAQSDGF